MGAPHQPCLGVITGARGTRGEVRIRTFTERAEDIAAYGPLTDETGARSFTLVDLRPIKGGIAARVEGIQDRTAAEALKGTQLYVARDALPDSEGDEFYHTDLLGMRVVTVNGEEFGRVLALHDFGAGDVLEIERMDGPPLVVPFTRDTVPEIDTDKGYLVLIPPPGLLNDDEVN
ncbi:MAG: ribosome maturation factor RimM [Alphaproteobacteria bacterium]|nr:ribosome maturation factor RimM [Alphaproteobacteria bacterium]